jgi:hypothetical protein
MSFCLALLCVVWAPKIKADEWNQATKVTFNKAIEVPGWALPSRTYWFTLLNDDTNRNVQIWNTDRTQLLATTLTVPDYRFCNCFNSGLVTVMLAASRK